MHCGRSLRLIVGLWFLFLTTLLAQAADSSTLNLSAASYTVAQNGGAIDITVYRQQPLTGSTSVVYSTTSGSAKSGVDYDTVNGTFNWSAGDNSYRRFTVPIRKTAAFVGNKTFTVGLSTPNGGTLGAPNSAVVSITGTGGSTTTLPALTFTTGSYSVAPSTGTINLTVTRSGTGVVSDVTFGTRNGTAQSGIDYTATNGKLSWTAGEAANVAKTIRVPIATSGTGNKSFTVLLSAANGATLAAPSTATINISAVIAATNWSAEVWSAAYSNPAKLDALWSKTAPITASNNAIYYARMNAWNSGAAGFRNQKTWARNEHDWGVTSNHVNDGQVKSYSSVVRGWASGDGFNGIANSGLGIQVSALTKARLRWAFNAPSDYGGVVGPNATNRFTALWDTYFHTMANPSGNDIPHTSLMINQYVVDGDGYYGGLAQRGQSVTLGGQQWQMHVFQSSWASGNTIELFPGPFNDYKILGKKDLTIDYRGVVRDLVAMGLIPNTDYLTSIQAGFEVISGGAFQTTQFWTALQNEVDGQATPPGSGATPTVSLTANPTSLLSGNSSTLTWSTTNANACSASGAWSGSKATSGSQSTGALAAGGTYTLTCTGTSGTASARTTITVITATPTPVPSVTLSASPTAIASGSSSMLTWNSTNATNCTATGAWSGGQLTSGTRSTGALTANATFTLTCTGAGGTTSSSATVTVSNTPPSGNCAGSGSNTSWVYYNGAMSPKWPYDYSWGGVVADYNDTSGVPLSGSADIKVTAPAWSGWQPASLNWSFDITGCNYLTFALKPTRANTIWYSAFLYVGDIPTGIVLNISDRGIYGPANPTVGAWNVYKIPLKDYFPNGVVPSTIYKFFLQEGSGVTNTWYIDNIGFTAN